MIKFKKVRWKNLLSTGNQFAEIFLDKRKNTIIVGQNGSGKSTMLDAICFGLFGRPFRNVRKPQLINSVNGSDMVVEIEFQIGSKDYLVRRGMKPNVFEIYRNGTLIEQDAKTRDYQKMLEQQILKCNYRSFTQVVILGSAVYTSFMELSATDRRQVIEDLLDISVFSIMNVLVKAQMSTLREELKDVDYEIRLIEEKIQLHEDHIRSWSTKKQESTEEINRKIQDQKAKIKELQSEISDLQSKTKNLTTQIGDLAELENRHKQLETYQIKMNHKVSSLKSQTKLLETSNDCPTCEMHLETDHKKKIIGRNTSKESDLCDGLTKLSKELSKTMESIKSRQQTQKEITRIQSKISDKQYGIDLCNNTIEHLKPTGKADDESGVLEERAKKQKLENDRTEMDKKKSAISEEQRYIDIISTMLKDNGIKSAIIRQYLPAINKLINKYLSALDFFVSFELDEQFNESIKSRHRDEFSYQSFSEGEKLRINLAILFAWRDVAKMKNCVFTNLLILDEILDSSLDAEGTEEFVELLKTGIDEKTNVFIISHKTDAIQDKFESVIRFEKDGNFSKLEVCK